MLIGGSTGDYRRLTDTRNNDKDLLQFFVGDEISSLEIMIHDKNNMECKLSPEILKKHISHRTLHAPVHPYQDDEVSHRIFGFLGEMQRKYDISNIVIHPDTVLDWNVFNQYPHLPISIENMDNDKLSHQYPEDLAKVFDLCPHIQFTLDLQHCFATDPSMQLAHDLHNHFGDRLVEYHISGYDATHLHYPLFKTQQDIIIDAIEQVTIPIIIESTFDHPGELHQEICYIHRFLKQKFSS